MARIYLTIALLIFVAAKLPAIENHPAGTRSLALSNAVVSVPDVWATFQNQATLATLNSFSAGVFYESRFLTDELSHTAITFVLPAKPGTFGLSFSQFGKGTFKEHKIGLAFSKMLSKNLAASVQLDYFSSRFPENERAAGFATFETGIFYLLSEKVTLAAHLFNPVQAGISTAEGKQKMPAVVRFGGHYKFEDKILVACEAFQLLNGPVQIRSGIEFLPVKNLALRFGVSGKPVNYTAGFGYQIGKLTTDIAFAYHGNLGITPSISIQIEL